MKTQIQIRIANPRIAIPDTAHAVFDDEIDERHIDAVTRSIARRTGTQCIATKLDNWSGDGTERWHASFGRRIGNSLYSISFETEVSL